MNDVAISIKGLNKTYAAGKRGGPKVALENIDLDIPRGSMFALLGPNGAGKSTMINIMAGLVLKSSGSVRIWDTDIDDDARQARANIGVVPQEINFDPFFSPRDLLDLQAGLYGVPKGERRTMELLEMMGLADKADVYSRTLSGGMRRRLMVAKAMVHSPPILVLDEPTAGVDIELRRQLWDNVRILNKNGVTVLLTTHYLEEAQALCDTIAIINHGKIVACESKEAILSRIDNKVIRFRLDKPVGILPEALERFHPQVEKESRLVFHYSPGEMHVGGIITEIQKAGYGINDISTEESDLEDVFLQLTKAQ